MFTCPTCGTHADFTAMSCPTCGALLAYVPERDTFLITGKLWPKMFEVRFVPARAASKARAP